MNSDRPTNLIITGVGGQGNILAVKILASALQCDGYEVSVGEVFGLAQRGGSVSSHLRFWRGYAPPPLVPVGLLDILVGFEPLEALRILCQNGNRNTHVLINSQTIPPIGALTGRFQYPSLADMLGRMELLTKNVRVIEGQKITKELDNPQVLNMVMVGALIGTHLLPLSMELIEAQMKKQLPVSHREINRQAFTLGSQALDFA
jgi:indolepyruvate ferredoxin oxidoreductase beta subunit